MATVYQARHTSLPRDVAIKILHPGLASNQRNRERFEREAKAIEQLDHPNIVQILDYSGQSGNSCYIITELIEGLTLRQLMEEQREIPSEIIVMIGIELCKALEYAHSLGLIHRDIKLENVMLRKDGTVKLMDFGIARFSEETQLTLTGTLVGSPAYMSPEQALEEPIDHRSDLFSLGTLLFHLATRELPFHGSNPSVILKNIIDNQRNQPHHITPKISIKLNEIIDNLLQTSLDKRIQSASELYEALHQVFEESDIAINDETWSIKYWLADPSSYQMRLEQHLIPTLLERGKELLNVGKHLEAQLYFNRLLSIDPNNEPVFALLQEMHTATVEQGNSSEKKQRWWPFLVPIFVSFGMFLIFQKNTETTNNLSDVLELEPLQNKNPEKRDESSDIQQVKISNSLLTSDIKPEKEDISGSKTAIFSEKNTNEASSLLSNKTSITEETEEAPLLKPAAQNIKDIKTIKPQKIAEKKVEKKVEKRVEKNEKTNPTKRALSDDAQTKTEKLSPPKPVQKGKLTVSIPNTWADIWIDDEKVGRTGQVAPIEIIPGDHVLRLENKYSLPYEENFSIVSGEDKHIRIATLKRKPASVVFPSQYEKDCLVKLDKKDVGSLQDLGYRLSIIEPNLPHQISLSCNEEIYLSEISQLSPGSSVPVIFD